MLKLRTNKKIFLAFMLALLLFVQTFGLLFLAEPVMAAGAPVVVTESVPEKTTEIKKTIGAMLLSTAMGAMLHAADYFMRRLAYDTAVYLATGGNGQGQLIFEGKPGKYFEQEGLNAAADAIDELAKPFGLNLCQNPNLDFQVFLKIGLRSLYVDYWGGSDGPKPSCTWQNLKLKDHWNAVKDLASKESTERAFTNALRFEESDLGVTVGAMAKMDRMQAVAEKGAELERLIGKGFKDATELVTGNVTTPADIVAQESYAITNKGKSEMQMNQVAGIYGSGALQMFPMAGSVFLNTFLSQGMKTLQEKLLTLGQGKGDKNKNANVLSFESAGFQSSRRKAESVFSSILTANIQQMDNYQILEEFAACPSEPVKPGLNNCVIDMGLRNALDLARQGTQLTIQEAMDRGLLRKDWPFVSPKRIADNTSKDCYQKGYCYSNIQKLRRNRILPLGFEIAALLADPDNPEKAWTLEKVVRGFDQCEYKNGKVVPNFAKYPYCHLIDPNWILKAPDIRCNAKVYSSILSDADSGQRTQECVDITTRLKEKTLPGTSEQDNYGYCVREKNVWKLGGEECEPQYGTCTTFVSSKTNSAVSYLARTVDYGECNLSNIGCMAYSAEEKDGKWMSSVDSKAVYFNERINNYTCPGSEDGCSAFYLGNLTEGGYVNSYNEDNKIYIKKAPDYLGCYDSNAMTKKIEWPQTKVELANVEKSKSEKCNSFSQACLPEEVNCDSYTPSGGVDTLAVPAVVGEKNYCDEACVGYETFRQSPTWFAPAKFPLYFIPENGQSCSKTHVGCDEFTNIDEAAKGGEGLEYYSDLKYCERPTKENEAIFYSWEGSNSEGYVLKTHKLRPITAIEHEYLNKLKNAHPEWNWGVNTVDGVFPEGSPAYASDSPDAIKLNYELCNADGYNKMVNGAAPGLGGTASIDCRALYDKKGRVFYRLLKDTITVSSSCHPLRKTESYLYVDSLIEGQTECENDKRGSWSDDPSDNKPNESVCRRCSNGGFYENGKCIYWAISQPGESMSCPASANGCREYTGNRGGNLQLALTHDFEPSGKDDDALNKAKEGWGSSPIPQLPKVVAESIQVGTYSLQVSTGQVWHLFSFGEMQSGQWYDLSFWAKSGTGGKSQSLDIYFKQDDNELGRFTFDAAKNQNFKLGLSSDWQEYKLGPVRLENMSGDSPLGLIFDRSGGGQYFLDNVRMYKLSDTDYLIKDSWKTQDGDDVPLICDAVPGDTYPGEALGCKLYTEQSTGAQAAIVGFEKMCRVDAVGCRAVFDTQNTEEETMTVYNSWCQLGKAGTCDLQVMVGGENKLLGSCKVEAGAVGCYVEKIVLDGGVALNPDWVVSSTVVVPADTPIDSPLFMTARQEHKCSDQTGKYLGCRRFGLETQILPDKVSASFEHSDVYVLNDPEKYVGAEGTLCRDDLVGCEEFSSANGVDYFKNPVLLGNSFCEYKTPTEDKGAVQFGWFKKSGENKPCYDNYLLPGGENGIWSNESEFYDGYVGVCPSEKNGCTEFIDPADTSDLNPEGRPYYALFNEKLEDRIKSCDGQVSLKKGCVLFNKTDEPNLLYSSKATYEDSENTKPDKYDLVSPVSAKESVDDANDKDDANIILKVDRDRECGEWLSCRGYLPIPDPQSESGVRYGCYALQSCQSGTHFQCAVEAEQGDAGELLTYDKYVQRDVSWEGGKEYSGYSLYGQYPVSDLSFVGVTTGDKEKKFLLAFADNHNVLCTQPGNNDYNPCGDFGYCYKKQCVYSPNNSYPKDVKNYFFRYLYSDSCRGYPEAQSPFLSSGLVDSWQGGRPLVFNQQYKNAKLCQKGEDCDCNYLQIGFGENGSVSETRYYSLGSSNKEANDGGICQGGGIKDGQACVTEKDCQEPGKGAIGAGTCLRQQQRNSRIGWNGYCLERDLTRRINGRTDNSLDAFACLTWYPLDYVPGLFDIYYNDPGKGYVPPAPGNVGQYYCAAASPANDMGGSKELTSSLLEDSSAELAIYVQDKNWQSKTYSQSTLFTTLDGFETGARDVLSGMPAGLDGRFKDGSYEYISRIDTKFLFANNKYLMENDTTANSIEANFDYKSILDLMFKSWLMNDTAFGGNFQWSEFFPEPDKKAPSKDAAGVKVLVPSSDKNDSGILWHPASMFEKHLSNKTAAAVSWIPLFAKDGGDITTVYRENPAFLNLHQIFFNKEYPSASALPDNAGKGEIEFLKSTMGGNNCTFCKWWVLKTDYPEKNQDGYLLQWWQDDPAANWSEYINTQSHRVNPLGLQDGKPSVVCEQDEDKGHPETNWLALEFLFNKDTGLFEGYKSRWCEASDYTHGIASAISWTMRPYCSELVQVFDSSSVQETNKAYTDRVWEFGDYNDVSIKVKGGKSADPFIVKYGEAPIPFMSARVNDVTQMVTNNRLLYFGEDDGASEMAGLAYSCPENLGNNFSAQCSLKPYTFAGLSINIPSPSEFTDYLMDEPKLSDGKEEIRKLFVKSYKQFGVKPNLLSWDVKDTPLDFALFWGRPPYIYPAIECEGSTCRLDIKNKNNFSVNGIGGTKADSALYGKKSIFATAKMFTWADHNQMPIRRIMFDWGDNGVGNSGVISGETKGYYSNYKPYCASDGNAKECYPASSVLVTDTNPLIGWIGKKASTEKFKGPVACTTDQNCKTEFQKMIGESCGESADYPAINKLGCYSSKCYKITQEGTYTQQPVFDAILGSFVSCNESIDCWNYKSKPQVKLTYYNQPIEDVIKNGNFDDMGCFDGLCRMYINPEYSADSVTGWLCKEVKGIYDDEKQGQVSCSGPNADQMCKDKFEYMVKYGYGSSKNYPSPDLLKCYFGYCHQQVWKTEDVVVEESKLTGMTCDSNNDCQTPTNACVDVGQHFGNQDGLTCSNQPAVRFFNYTCNADVYIGAAGKPSYVKSLNEIKTEYDISWYNLLKAKGHADTDLVCVFKPKAQVLDNWGWCTGDCEGVGKGCYNEKPKNLGFEKECDENEKRWIGFSNIVVVAP